MNPCDPGGKRAPGSGWPSPTSSPQSAPPALTCPAGGGVPSSPGPILGSSSPPPVLLSCTGPCGGTQLSRGRDSLAGTWVKPGRETWLVSPQAGGLWGPHSGQCLPGDTCWGQSSCSGGGEGPPHSRISSRLGIMC